MRHLLEKLRSPSVQRGLNRVLLAGYFLGFAAVFVLLLSKCPYGYGTADETFWLTVPRRFLQGDRLLVDESHMTQFAFLTMVPEMWVYKLLGGTPEGIVLAFRYIYTVLWSAGCLFLFFRTRKINQYAAMCASLFLQSFAPYGIMAFSYNSLAVLYLTNSAIFMLCARRHQKAQFFLSGLFFAGAVLCCPYLALVYFLYSAGLGIARLRGKKPQIVWTGTDACDFWRCFTLGVCALAALVLSLLFSRATPKMVWEAIQFALTDPEHASFSFLYKTTEYFTRIAGSNAYFYPMLAVLILMTALTLYRKRVIWFVLVCAASVVYLRQFLVEYAYINYLMFPLTFVGLYILIVTRRKDIRQIGLLWLLPGILYTYCSNYTSNQFFFAISSASAVSSTAAIYMMWLYCGELRQEYRDQNIAPRLPRPLRPYRRYMHWGACAAVALYFVFQLKYEIPVRYQSVYWEAGLMKYETQMQLTEGPEKGIICTLEYGENYNRLYPDVKEIDGKRVLFLSEEFWMELLNDNENASYSGWLGRAREDSMARLENYYQRNPHKVPELIFLEGKYDRLLSFFDESSYEIVKTEIGNYLITPRQLPDASTKVETWP